MNKRGFTLAEVIAVVVVLSILLLFTVPPVNRIIDNSKNTAYQSQINNIIEAARDWSIQNSRLLPEEGKSITIFLGELKAEGVITIDLKNPLTKKNISNSTSISITNIDGEYKYEVNIIDIENVEDKNSPILIISGNIVDYVEVNQSNIAYVIPEATAKTVDGVEIESSYISYQILKDNTEVSSIDTSSMGIYVINYSVTYEDKTGNYQKTVIVRDTTAPEITIDNNMNISSSDASVNFMEGVSIVDNSGEVITPTISTSISSIEGSYYVYYTATDSSGNSVTKRREIVVYKDKPTLPLISGGSEDWTSSLRTISVTNDSTSPSGISKYQYYISTSNTRLENGSWNDMSGKNIGITTNGINYIYVRAVANNGQTSAISHPEITKIDNVTPTVSISATKYCNGTEVLNNSTSDDLLEFTFTETSNNVSGTKIYYCKDTSNSCSPTIEYNEKVYIESTGTYYIRYKIVSGASKSSSISSFKATVNDTTYCAVNLVQNGSFENGLNSWDVNYGGNINSSVLTLGGYHGSYSLKFIPNIQSMAQQYIGKPKVNHKYYGSIMFKSSSTFTSGDNRYEWYTTDADNALLKFANKDSKTTTWTKKSSIKSLTNSNYLDESRNWKIRNFLVNSNEYVYSDALMIIDLTDTFGAGNEPTKEWCDANLQYFDGRKTVYTSTYVTEFDGTSLYTNGDKINSGTSVVLPSYNKSQYGPNYTLASGCYRVIYYGKNLDNEGLWYNANGNATMIRSSLETNYYTASYYFTKNNTSITDFQLYNNNTNNVSTQVDKIVLYRSDACPSS